MSRRDLVYAAVIGWAIGMVANSSGPPSLQGYLAVGMVAGGAAISWYFLDRWLTQRKRR